MGLGTSVEKIVKEDKEEMLMKREDNSSNIVNLHVTIVSSISLAVIAVVLFYLLCIVIKLRMCTGVCGTLCCEQCTALPNSTIMVTQSRLPVLQGTKIVDTADREGVWAEEETDFSFKQANPPTNSCASSWGSHTQDNSNQILSKLARQQ